MARLHVLAGLPGSGKSTRAEVIIAETGAVLVSRDELAKALRRRLHPGIENEVMRAAADRLLAHGCDVVVDAWNLHPGDRAMWQMLAEDHGVTLTWELLDTPVEVCIFRDLLRPEPNGEARVRAAATWLS